jgi:hypothetical protein
MKKILSILLVACMVAACFVITPASAEIYRDNILTFTEENSNIVYAKPWESGAVVGNICSWTYPFDMSPTEVDAIEVSTDSAAIMDGENRFGNAHGIKFNLSKLGTASHYVNILTTKVEPTKTYTFFFKLKASTDANLSNILIVVAPAESYTGGAANMVVGSYAILTLAPTTEWQTVKFTFTAADTLSADTTALQVVVAKQGETDGVVYVDGLALVEGTNVDEQSFYANYIDPTRIDTDNDGIYNGEDADVDGDGIFNTFDNDIDGDGLKNVWDRDIDGDGVTNAIDEEPFSK